jgi:hypothetical protein
MGEQQQLLQERLSDAKALEARHGLSAAEEEKRELMETHRRDVDELERQILKFQREKRELEAEVESVMAQLVEERQTSRSLRVGHDGDLC